VKIVTATIDNEVNKSFVLRQGDKPERLTERRHRIDDIVGRVMRVAVALNHTYPSSCLSRHRGWRKGAA